MKLVKIKRLGNFNDYVFYIENISSVSLAFRGYRRTLCQKELKLCISTIETKTTSLCSTLDIIGNNQIVYEIEFEKLEDLIELVPEEFL